MANNDANSSFDFDELIILLFVMIFWIALAAIIQNNFPSLLNGFELFQLFLNTIPLGTIHVPILAEIITITVYAGGKAKTSFSKNRNETNN